MAEHFAPIVKGSGPGLLLAHGAGGTIENNFGPIIDDLARTHTVIGPDYPGSGTTPRSAKPLVLDELADTLVATAVTAGVDRFTILGYSLGTAVAVRAATRHPDRVDGLILTAGFAFPDNRLRLAADIWRALLDSGDRLLTAKFLTFAAPSARYVNDLTPEQLDAALAWLADALPAGSPEQVALAAGADTRTELGSISVPTLVIATTLDGLAGPTLSRQLANGIPNAELVEVESGHIVGAEAPAAWLAAIRKFLEADPPAHQG